MFKVLISLEQSLVPKKKALFILTINHVIIELVKFHAFNSSFLFAFWL